MTTLASQLIGFGLRRFVSPILALKFFTAAADTLARETREQAAQVTVGKRQPPTFLQSRLGRAQDQAVQIVGEVTFTLMDALLEAFDALTPFDVIGADPVEVFLDVPKREVKAMLTALRKMQAASAKLREASARRQAKLKSP